MAERVREKRNLPHPKKRGMAFFRFYFFNILIGLVIVVATVVLLSVTIFQITKVSVKGNAVLSDDEISALVITGKYPKNGLYEWFINTVHPKTDIPFVDTYTMSFKKPSNVVINVHEVNMIGYIPMVDGTYAYFDGDGKVVEISERLVAGYLPVSGITCDGAKVGKTLPINIGDLKDLYFGYTSGLHGCHAAVSVSRHKHHNYAKIRAALPRNESLPFFRAAHLIPFGVIICNDFVLIDGILEHRRIDVGPPQVYACHILEPETAATRLASAKFHVREVIIIEGNIIHFRAAEISPVQIASVKCGPSEIYPLKIAAGQIDPFYNAVAHVRHGAGRGVAHSAKLSVKSLRRFKAPLVAFRNWSVGFIFFYKIHLTGSEVHLCSLSFLIPVI